MSIGRGGTGGGGGKDILGRGKNLLKLAEARKNMVYLRLEQCFSPPGARYALEWGVGNIL